MICLMILTTGLTALEFLNILTLLNLVNETILIQYRNFDRTSLEIRKSSVFLIIRLIKTNLSFYLIQHLYSLEELVQIRYK